MRVKRRTPGLLTTLRESTPLVTIHAHRPEPAVPDLEANDESGLYAATAHLIALGHRRIAHLPGGMDSLGGQRRLNGYRRSLQRHGIAYGPDLLISPGGFGKNPATTVPVRSATVYPLRRR